MLPIYIVSIYQAAENKAENNSYTQTRKPPELEFFLWDVPSEVSNLFDFWRSLWHKQDNDGV